MGGVYGLGWVVVLNVTIQGSNPVWAPWILPFTDLFLLHGLAAFLLLIGMLVGWTIPQGQRSKPVTSEATRLSEGVNPKHWMLSFWLMLTAGVVAQVLYSRAYGGLLGQLEYSEFIRSSVFEVLPSNPWSFLNPISGLVLVAALGFLGLVLSGYYQISNILGMLSALIASIYVLYNGFGRLAFVAFIASLFLSAAIMKQQSPIRLLVGAIVVGTAMLAAAYWISLWLELKPADNIIEFVARELSFPFGSFYGQITEGSNLFRCFTDILLIPVFVLPSSIWSNWIEPVSQLNTAVIMGAPKGHSGVTGGIPVDLITLGLMQLHLPGIVIVGGLFGIALRWVQLLLDRVPIAGIRAAFTANVSLTLATVSVFYAQPNLLVANHINWLIAGIVVWIVVGVCSRLSVDRKANRVDA